MSLSSDLETSSPTPTLKMVMPLALALSAAAFVSSGLLDFPSVIMTPILGTPDRSPLALCRGYNQRQEKKKLGCKRDSEFSKVRER